MFVNVKFSSRDGKPFSHIPTPLALILSIDDPYSPPKKFS
jgi:hypothetical protein